MMTLRNILIATDFEEASLSALAYARELARRFEATLHVIHVVDDVGARTVTAAGLPYDVSRMQTDLEQDERERLDRLVTDEDRTALRAKVVQVVSLSPAHEIVTYAAAEKIDLVVLGTHGRGALQHLVMGSVAERVVRLAPCPVLTVRHPEREFIGPDALQVVGQSAHGESAS
jgi:nucleotide-binding universal stress UspA family protein